MRRKGTYVIVLTLGADAEVRIGALGTFHFDKGSYCYVGSAMGGLDARVQRHLRKEKALRWHVDYLTTISSDSEAYISYPEPVPECDLARMAEDSGMIPCTDGFGCSDCSCRTHLFKVTDGSLGRLIDLSGINPYDMSGTQSH